MLESRFGDLREESLTRQGKGHFHVSSRGHEAMVAVGEQLRASDFLLPYYRDRGMCLGRGVTTKHLALEYFAKRDSASCGRMLPSHYSLYKMNIVSVPTPLGVQLLPACGVAWGMKLDGKDSVVVTTLGDATTRQGDFYEAISFALERKLPMLFIVEDNAYGISTPTRDTNPLAIAVLNATQWIRINGSDVEEVYATAKQAIERLRADNGPVFIWAKVERLSAHTSSDDHTIYRTKKDIAAMEKSDPIRVLGDAMLESGEISQCELTHLEEEIKKRVRAEYNAAEKAADPRADELFFEVNGPTPKLNTALFNPGKYRMGDLINRTLRAGLDADPARMIFGEDVEDPKGGVFRLTQKLSTDFPQQVFNSPLAESTIFGVGGGLALYGRKPVFELQFIDFSFQGFNQIASNLANLRWRSNGEWKVPAVFYASYGAYLPGGSMWHSQANEAAYAHFPGLNIVVPSTPKDAAGLLWTAMHGEDPTIFLIPKHMLWAEIETTETVTAIPFGQALLCTKGSDLTVVAWGNTIEKSQEAIAVVGDEVSVELIDLRSILPWDKAAVETSVLKTGRLVVAQEDTEACSVGQMVITHITSRPEIWSILKAPPILVTKGNVMIGYNPIYEYAALPDVERISKAIRAAARSNPARTEKLPSEAVEVEIDGPVELASELSLSIQKAHAPRNTVVADTNDIVVRVPAMGEGLRSARVVTLNKKSGDPVKQDEVLCELETDKAVYPLESSFAGEFKAWKIKIDDTVLIGQEIALVTGDAASVKNLLIESAAETETKPVSSAPKCAVPVAVKELVPKTSPLGKTCQPALVPSIIKRLNAVVPANMLLDCRWEALCKAREMAKVRYGKAAASPSAMMAWCVVRVIDRHATFRRIVHSGVILEQTEFEMGVAVALEGNQLATAAIPAANSLSWVDFVAVYNREVQETRAGKIFEVQAPLNITSFGAFGIESATPIVVPPATSTLFIGTAHEKMINDGGAVYPTQVITLSLTFDHKVVNGATAAAFMHDLKRTFETFTLPI